MGKKPSTSEKPDESSLWPYITQIKSPRWLPFPFLRQIPSIQLPVSEKLTEIEQVLQKFIATNRNLPISSAFWYLLSKKFLKLPYDEMDYALGDYLLHYEVIGQDFIGFRADIREIKNKPHPGKSFESPDVWSTFYALASLNFLGKLQEYLQFQSDINKRNKIISYIEKTKKSNGYLHCLNPNCPICHKGLTPETTFYVMCIYELIGLIPNTIPKEILNSLKNSVNPHRDVFRFLSLQYVNSKESIKDEDLVAYYKLQKTNGGFTFQNSAFSDINDTFWIGYLLNTYSWLIPVTNGPLFSYLIAELRKFEPSEVRTEKRIKEFSQIVTLTVLIWDSLIDELETLLFQNISPQGVLDLNVLSIRGGISGAEAEVVAYINNKYNLTLEIQDNAIQFRRFLNKLDPFLQKFAKKLYDYAAKFAQFDISEIRSEYNKGRPKKNQITDDFLIKLLQQMISEFFFHGRIFKKGIIAKTYFTKDDFVERIIVCDRPVSFEDINKEKRRLKEVSEDIYNMTHEMESSADHIYREVESLIIAEEVDLAEERLKSNIQKALFDATFFNKNIEAFQQEFILIKAKDILSPLVNRWQDIYGRLQNDFNNIHHILMEKIKDLQEEQDQRKIALKLEELVNNKVNDLADQFDAYNTQFRTALEAEYTRAIVQDLEQQLDGIETQISMVDQNVESFSMQITSKNEDITQLRKKTVDNWISHQEDFHNLLQFYHQGFQTWNEKINQLDITHKNIVVQIENVGKKINEAIQQNDYGKAVEINNRSFTEISQDIDTVTSNLNEELDPVIKNNRKLHALFRTIQTEWIMYQNVLQKLLHQMQEEFTRSIQQDRKWNMKEEFHLLIEKSTITLRDQYVAFEKAVNSVLVHQKDVNKTSLTNDLHSIYSTINNFDQAIQKKSEELFPQIGEYATEAQQFLDSWQFFKQQYKADIDVISAKITNETLLYTVLQYAKTSNLNYLLISALAEQLKLEPAVIETHLKDLISNSRLNAIFLEDTHILEVHNEEWRNSERLHQTKEVLLREIQTNAEKIESLYSNAIEDKTFHKNTAQFISLRKLFEQKIANCVESYSNYVRDHALNLSNELIKKEDEDFWHAIENYRQMAKTILEKCQKSTEYQELLDQKFTKLEETIHSEIHRINVSLATRNMDDYKKNLKWFEDQKVAIEKGIENVKAELGQIKEKIWNEVSGAESILVLFQQYYDDRLNSLLQFFDTACNDILEKLSSSQLNLMRQQMEVIIKQKEEHLNQILLRYEKEIKDKIDQKLFKEAAHKLVEKSKLTEQELKLIEKDIKNTSKGFEAQSKVFGIKHKYLIEQWELFLLDYLNSMHEKELLLEQLLVEQYVKYAIKALKGQILSIKMVSDDLFMKHDYVINRLMGLIGDNRLPGKIDLNHDIYFEGQEALDPETIASFDLMKVTNVRTFLGIQRLTNLFKTIYPFFAVAGVLITIAWYLHYVTSEPFIIASPFILLAVIIFVYWLKKGRDKVLPAKGP